LTTATIKKSNPKWRTSETSNGRQILESVHRASSKKSEIGCALMSDFLAKIFLSGQSFVRFFTMKIKLFASYLAL
jgi:hypothetical protein